MATIAERTQLTPRQVSYCLKSAQGWLEQRGVNLLVTPGVGVLLERTPDQQQRMVDELADYNELQIVLSPGERQQLLCLHLLTSDDPLILVQLTRSTQTSRTTVLRDLDEVGAWVGQFGLELERRPNYGFAVAGPELARRQALSSLLWGENPFGDPLTSMTYQQGLVNNLQADSHLLPILTQFGTTLKELDTRRAVRMVTFAEANLGGRYTDEGVLHLALAFAIQAYRSGHARHLHLSADTFIWLRSQPIWHVAAETWDRFHLPVLTGEVKEAEIAGIAMHLLAGSRNERWPADLEIDASFSYLIEGLVTRIATAYAMPQLADDKSLWDGLVAHVVPACLRQRFGLWMPSLQVGATLPSTFATEQSLAQELTAMIRERTGADLTPGDIANLALLLRAAYIRERPSNLQRVIVVCPSGMATAQLLVARLKARFPHLGKLDVLSVRQLNGEQLRTGQLLITTIPLPDEVRASGIQIIKVHPLLLPEDVDTITKYLEQLAVSG